MTPTDQIVNDRDYEYHWLTRSPNSSRMKSEAEWTEDVKRLLRTEMARRGITYKELADRLASVGVQDTEVNLRTKVARGRFSAVFFVQCLRAIGARALRLNDDTDQ
jgi:hypothetical protein